MVMLANASSETLGGGGGARDAPAEERRPRASIVTVAIEFGFTPAEKDFAFSILLSGRVVRCESSRRTVRYVHCSETPVMADIMYDTTSPRLLQTTGCPERQAVAHSLHGPLARVGRRARDS
jgi:hypothetical protein